MVAKKGQPKQKKEKKIMGLVTKTQLMIAIIVLGILAILIGFRINPIWFLLLQ